MTSLGTQIVLDDDLIEYEPNTGLLNLCRQGLQTSSQANPRPLPFISDPPRPDAAVLCISSNFKASHMAMPVALLGVEKGFQHCVCVSSKD